MNLTVKALSRGTTWIDAGTPSALSRATNYIFTIETNHGLKIACPEEAALIRGLIDETKLEALISNMNECEYKQYLADLVFCRKSRTGLSNGEQFFVQQHQPFVEYEDFCAFGNIAFCNVNTIHGINEVDLHPPLVQRSSTGRYSRLVTLYKEI